jgi:hypothetical protein
VSDHVGQADLGGEAGVPVDGIEIAGGAGVAHQRGPVNREPAGRQLGADLDLVERGHQLAVPRATSVA